MEYALALFPPRNESDRVYCHAVFNNTRLGNTVVWEYVNEPSSLPKTWSLKKEPIMLNQTSHGLSGIQSAGIGIGSGLGVMVVIGTIWFLIRRQISKRKQIPHFDNDTKLLGGQTSRPVLTELNSDDSSQAKELDAAKPVEMDAGGNANLCQKGEMLGISAQEKDKIIHV